MEIFTIILLFICAIALVVLSTHFILHDRQVKEYIEGLNERLDFYAEKNNKLSKKDREIKKGSKDEKRDNPRKNKRSNSNSK